MAEDNHQPDSLAAFLKEESQSAEDDEDFQQSFMIDSDPESQISEVSRRCGETVISTKNTGPIVGSGDLRRNKMESKDKTKKQQQSVNQRGIPVLASDEPRTSRSPVVSSIRGMNLNRPELAQSSLSSRATTRLTSPLPNFPTITPLFPTTDMDSNSASGTTFSDAAVITPLFPTPPAFPNVELTSASAQASFHPDTTALPSNESNTSILRMVKSKKKPSVNLKKAVEELWAAKIMLQAECGLEAINNIRVSDVVKQAISTIKELELEYSKNQQEIKNLMAQQANLLDRIVSYKKLMDSAAASTST